MKTFPALVSAAAALLLAISSPQGCAAFAPAAASPSSSTAAASTSSSPTALSMAGDFNNIFRSARQASAEDRVVELKRPLGIVLDEDDNGNVFVDTVAPRGNAARTNMVQEGDVVTMCSSTFGDEMWSCRGAGLSRVLSAIRLRAGPTVKLVFENSSQSSAKKNSAQKSMEAAELARKRAQDKKDSLLKELESDNQKLKKGKFLGLF